MATRARRPRTVPRRRWVRGVRRVAVALLVALLLPVPWQHKHDSRLGLAWRLDGRLVVDGERVDPPGRYSWLTVGRPALVAELAWERVSRPWRAGAPPIARDLRHGLASSRPRAVEPVAAAVGLAAAGREVHLAMEVVVSGPTHPGLPETGTVTHVNGGPVPTRAAYQRQLASPLQHGQITFRVERGVERGSEHGVEGDRLPYRSVRFVDVVEGVEAAVGGHGPPYSWIRSMSMGASHGLMVGLVAYASASGDDLAAGRHVAGTGQLFGDGTVGPIGGLAAKAAGARRAGADVLLVPASQRHQLDGVDTGQMLVLPVDTLEDAITQLRATR